MHENLMFQNTYDVAICGSGLGGLTRARQLKLKIPNISHMVLDRREHPNASMFGMIGMNGRKAPTVDIFACTGMHPDRLTCPLPEAAFRVAIA